MLEYEAAFVNASPPMERNGSAVLTREEAIRQVSEARGSFKVALSMAVSTRQACLTAMTERLFQAVYERGWSFDADGEWRRLDEPGSHRTPEEMSRLFFESLVVRQDRSLVKAMERKAHDLVPESQRLQMLVEVLYDHGGGVDASGSVIPPRA